MHGACGDAPMIVNNRKILQLDESGADRQIAGGA